MRRGPAALRIPDLDTTSILAKMLVMRDPTDPFAINAECLAEIARLQAEVARLSALVPQVHLPLPSRAEIDRVEDVVLRALRARGIEESREDVAAFVYVFGELQRAAFKIGRPREVREDLVR